MRYFNLKNAVNCFSYRENNVSNYEYVILNKQSLDYLQLAELNFKEII